jgi:hypothetical protein
VSRGLGGAVVANLQVPVIGNLNHLRSTEGPAPASPPRAILSRSGDAMALLGLGSSARGAPDEVHRSCSPGHGPVGLGQGPKGRAPNATRSRSGVRRHQCGRSRAGWLVMKAPGGCPGRPADLNQVRASSHFLRPPEPRARTLPRHHLPAAVYWDPLGHARPRVRPRKSPHDPETLSGPTLALQC